MDKKAKITVVGVGGGGTNAVNRMIEAGLSGVDFCVMNTESQALEKALAERKLQLGESLTHGLGAGGNPIVGQNAAEESKNDITKALEGSNLVFISAGMGGGTGTGAAPVIARIARELKALTIAVVTKPFKFEGPRRLQIALDGVEQLRQNVDALIVVPNERLLTVAEKRTTLLDAFRMADDILAQGVRGISDIITVTGLVDVDLHDVETVMSGAGPALMGIGVGRGEHKAREAAEAATRSPLMETPIEGARRVLLNVTSGPDFSLQELAEATSIIEQFCDPKDNLTIYGHVFDETLEDEVRITVLAAGQPGLLSGDAAVPSLPNLERRSEPVTSQPVATAAPTTQPVTPKPAATSRPADASVGNDYDIPAFLRRSRQNGGQSND